MGERVRSRRTQLSGDGKGPLPQAAQKKEPDTEDAASCDPTCSSSPEKQINSQRADQRVPVAEGEGGLGAQGCEHVLGNALKVKCDDCKTL